MKGILGRKVGMTQIFTEDGKAIAVTVIEAGPCTVVQKRTPEKDGYSALQLGFMEKQKHESKFPKPLLGHFRKAGLSQQDGSKKLSLTTLTSTTLVTR